MENEKSLALGIELVDAYQELENGMVTSKILDRDTTATDIPTKPSDNKCLKYPLIVFRLFFPSNIFIKFLVVGLIPAVSDQLIPLFFTGNIPSESALALAGQFVFISVLLEVIQEGIVNSLFFFVGQCYKDDRKVSLQALKLCLLVLAILGSVLTIIMLACSSEFVKLINTPAEIAESTVTYIWVSSFTYPLFLVTSALMNHLYISTSWLLMVCQLVQVVTSFLINFFLFGTQATSLHWGVDRLGHYKIIQSCVNLLNNFIFLFLVEKMTPITFFFRIPLTTNFKQNCKSLLKVSWGNFGDSAVRNFFYFMVTLKFLNYLGVTEAGAWNLLNTIVWGFLLIPSFAVASYVKVQVGHSASFDSYELKTVIKKVGKESFLCLTSWLFVIAIVVGICWPALAAYFNPNNQAVNALSATMFLHVGWVFIVFSYNNAMDSLFFGTGKTSYIFYQSLITNLVVYFIPWILYLTDVLIPTYWWILGLYISGMLVDFGLTAYFCVRLWQQIG